MDEIIIEDLEVSYHVGVPDAERANPQRLLISVRMKHDFAAAARRDDLSKTIDYFAVSQRLLGFGAGRNWKLIEKLAVDIAETLQKEFRISSISVEIKKFIIPQAKFVAVRITR